MTDANKGAPMLLRRNDGINPAKALAIGPRKTSRPTYLMLSVGV